MCEERIIQKAEGTFVLVACQNVGIDNAYPYVKDMHAFTNNGFPTGTPDLNEKQSIWSMFRDDCASSV